MKKLIISALAVGAVLATPFVFRHDIRALIDDRAREKAAPPAVSVTELKKEGQLSYTKPMLMNLLLKKNSTTKKADPVAATSTPVVVPPPSSSLPEEFNLNIPFTSQAPHANWNYPYQEACEEASALMSKWFVDGVTSKTPDQSDKELRAMIEWEKKNLGYYEDSTAEDTLRIFHEYLGMRDAFIVDNPTPQQIKKYVAQGYPVVVPASGTQLNNPNFRNGGPPYHMVVIRGYTEKTFITNDPGTRKGKNYQYSIDTIMRAMHDWNDGNVLDGAKKIIVVKY